MEEFRLRTLRKIQAHPTCDTLSKLILERMPMDALELLAPVVLDVDEFEDTTVDDITPRNCSNFIGNLLNRHYKNDTILELVGKNWEVHRRNKPNWLAEMMDIIDQRVVLKENNKKYKRLRELKVVMEFDSEDPFIRFSESYVSTKGFKYLLNLKQ